MYANFFLFLRREFKQKAKDHDFRIGWQNRYQSYFMVIQREHGLGYSENLNF